MTGAGHKCTWASQAALDAALQQLHCADDVWASQFQAYRKKKSATWIVSIIESKVSNGLLTAE